MQLELGCGYNGRDSFPEYNPDLYTNWLKRYGNKNTIAIDIDEKAIEFSKLDDKNNVTFIVADAKNIPFEDKYFELVHEQGVLHHINNYPEAIKEVARVLKNNGEFRLFETVDNYPIYALARKVAGSWQGNKIESYFKTVELIKELEKYFIIEKVDYYWLPLISDIIYFIKKGKYKGWLECMYISYYFNKLLRIMRLNKIMCVHVAIIASKK